VKISLTVDRFVAYIRAGRGASKDEVIVSDLLTVLTENKVNNPDIFFEKKTLFIWSVLRPTWLSLPLRFIDIAARQMYEQLQRLSQLQERH